MRFDDGLDTVLAGAAQGPLGVQVTWRQAVDLIGRGRGGPTQDAIARLRRIRDQVPVAVRIASARGLERADPPVALVALFADDDTSVAAPVVRSARLNTAEWIALLPVMRPATRGVLRHRRDLDPAITAALIAFGPDDFALPALENAEQAATASSEPSPPPTPEPAFVAPDPAPFVALADVARELPVVAEAMRRARMPDAPPRKGDFEIADIVARIEAHQRTTETKPLIPLPREPDPVPDRFRFETDRAGAIRWTDNPARGPLIGLSLAGADASAPAATDAVASGAFARRARFTDARLQVPGGAPVAGAWRVSATPVFDHASGRFTGYRGTARRPRPDEEPHLSRAAPAADSLRQLVHELRTPANAISGFAEMIEHQMLGPVAPEYRARASEIRGQTGGLLTAIEDLDTAARLESGSFDLRREPVALGPIIRGVLQDLQPLADLRGASLSLDVARRALVSGDPRGLERLFGRLLSALVAAAAPGEAIGGAIAEEGGMVRCVLSRPAALPTADGALFSADAEREAAAEGGPLLGGGFALRLARRLITEQGGSLTITAESLTVRLPAAVSAMMGQATV